ncbi:hypothetical protein KC727_02570 [Candidatus Kaiserbacteria bacterium]|nr:hypothetical protein [Candidatus Kaiserbacteria bacterium]
MEHTAKNFALQLGSLIALYVSLMSLIFLLFSIITIAFPDPLESYWQVDSASSSIRSSIAMLIVFFPAYLVLTRKVNTARRRSEDYLKFTTWLVYLSLLLGGVVLLGDLVSVVNTFLNGELTIRFVLKALTVFVVIGAAFFYYLKDVRGYWQTHEKQSLQYGATVLTVVVVALILGFFHTETPAQVREHTADNTTLADLQDMEWHIENYYSLNGTVPKTLEEAYQGFETPTAVVGRRAYEYSVTQNGFQLCAEFAFVSDPYSNVYTRPLPAEENMIKGASNWEHTAGWSCFPRVLSIP